jgi:predicted nucleotidyltransferase
MILSGLKRSAIWRAKSRMAAMAVFGGRLRGDDNLEPALELLVRMHPFYPLRWKK